MSVLSLPASCPTSVITFVIALTLLERPKRPSWLAATVAAAEAQKRRRLRSGDSDIGVASQPHRRWDEGSISRCESNLSRSQKRAYWTMVSVDPCRLTRHCTFPSVPERVVIVSRHRRARPFTAIYMGRYML